MISQTVKIKNFASMGLLSCFSMLSTPLLSHETIHPKSKPVSDYSETHSGKLHLYLKLIPENSQIDISSKDSLTSYMQNHRNDEGKTPEVGKITYIAAVLMRSNEERPSNFSLRIIQAEKEKEIIHTSIKSKNGVFLLGQQFYDGGPYRVEILASDESQSYSLKTVITTEVKSIEPPHTSVIKSLILLLLITGSGLTAGYFLGKLKK